MSDLFLRACRGEAVERRPVWMMRQAGRYLPEYRRVRERADFLTMCKTPELAAAVTVQPVDLVGVDAAILFADILLPLEAMGAELAFVEGEGPVFARPVRGAADVGALVRPDVDKTLGYVYAAIALLRRELAGRVPLIGFGGTPWTLAAYLIEGGTSKSHAHLLSWSWRDPDGLARLLDLLADVSLDYLRGQVEAGVQAIQLFDTWGGLLDRRRFRELAVPPVLKIVEGLGRQVPLIYYVRGGSHLLPDLAELPVDVLSVDWRLPLDEVRRVVGPRLVLQGNLDPTALLGEEASIVAATREVLDAGRGGGHVVNLGHGILPSTPPELFVETVKRHG
jgi:uroporphyrinogen decarboxylase